MANDRMFLVNRETGSWTCIAKYFPSTGLYPVEDITSRLQKLFAEVNITATDLSSVEKFELVMESSNRELDRNKLIY